MRLVSSRRVITNVNFSNIVMRETLRNNADWDCFRTLTLPEIGKTEHQHQVDSCAFSEAISLFQSVGCVRNKLQFHTVAQKLKYFLSMQVYA